MKFKNTLTQIWKFTRKFLLVALLIGITLWGLQQVLNRYNNRQLSGELSFDALSLSSDTVFTLGDFSVHWKAADKGGLSVTNNKNPDKVLWSNLPGQSFVAAGRGREKVTESRGSFDIQDKLIQAFENQTIERIRMVDGRLVVEGKVFFKKQDSGVGYEFGFYAIDNNQLQFWLTLDDASFNRLFLTYQTDEDEHFFGFGEQFSFFDMKGKRLPVFVSEQGIGRGEQPLTFLVDLVAKSGGNWHTSYAAVPQYISSKMRSVFLESTPYCEFDMRESDRMQIRIFSHTLTGRVLSGDSPADLISEYTLYAGRMRKLPDWILEGAVIGMQGGTDKVYKIYDQLKDLQTPVAAFWLQDWVGQRTTSFGKQLWWNWELDTKHYPNWKKLQDDLQKDSVRTMVYINSFLADVSDKGDYSSNLFAEADSMGYLVQKRKDDIPDEDWWYEDDTDTTYLIKNTSFSAGLLDLTNPETYAWMKKIIKKNVVSTGASGWMADFGEALPYDALLYSLVPAADMHNEYPVLWAQLNREVIDELENSGEYVFFMRAGYTQSPRYNTLFWLGDQMTAWDEHDGIKTAVTGLLSSGMSGFSLNHSDIGGYTAITDFPLDYHRSKELLLRWIELNAFTTIYRTHEGNKPDQNYQFYNDPQSLQHFSDFAKVYASWADYRKLLVEEASKTGLPIVRPLFLQYPNDENTYSIIYQEFMLGNDLLVVPVLDENTTSVDAYLPKGNWVYLWDGKKEVSDHGKTISVNAPIGKPCVFYRENSQVGEELMYKLQEYGLMK